MDKKRVVIPSFQEQTLRAVLENENGCDRRVLEVLAGLVLDGQEIEPDFQKVANAIVAQAVFFDALPPKKIGRPPEKEASMGIEIAARYYELFDRGMGYAKSVEAVAKRFHKDERHIMRLVKENKHWIGETREERDANRKWWQICREVEEQVRASGKKPASETMLDYLAELREADSKRDPITELDHQIDAVLERRFPTTDKKDA